MTGEIRELLARTGNLFTRDDTDPGHISACWRKKILELCDLLDSAPIEVGTALRVEKSAHVRTHATLVQREQEIAVLQQQLAGAQAEIDRALDRARAAELLVHQAVPRMRTLNNSMSPDWLRRAEEFLGS